MIDLHCHILPELDDGARDLEDAARMAAQAQADGIAAVCATPHVRHDHHVALDDLPRRREHLQRALAARGCTVRVLPGAEVAVTSLPELDDDALASLSLGGGGRWILLEPAPGPLDLRLTRAVVDLRRRGFAAVIAHPERHGSPDLFTRLHELVARGALVQATAAYFTHPSTREGMRALAGAGLVHVLGSDAHSSHAGRPVALGAGYGALSEVEPTASHIEWLLEIAPRAIVEGRDLRPPF